MTTVAELLAAVAPDMSAVQHATEPWVCTACLGPVNPDFSTCYACGRLSKAGVPLDLMRRVVPVSVAPRPGRWYNRLATYKAGHPELRQHMAAVAWAYFDAHRERYSEIAGGAISAVMPVPSKKGRTFDRQPLRQALAMVAPFRKKMVNGLRFVPAPDVDLRRSYYPGCFDPTDDDVEGHRVLLVEDTWVTGATCLSAAGALLRDGAAGVAIMPLGRVVDTGYWDGEGNPYLPRVHGDAKVPFELALWPR